MIPKLAKIGRALCPKGLMSSPKPASISTNLPETLTKFIERSFEYKADKAGIIYASFEKTNLSKKQID